MIHTDDPAFRERLARVEGLLHQVEQLPEAVQSRTREIVQTVLDLHAAGLARILDHLAAAGEPGARLTEALARDDLVGGLLLLYSLHPVDMETRVRQALEKVRPYLHSHGGNVELLEITAEGTVRLRMVGSCHSCPSSAQTLKLSIEEAIYEKAPDVAAIELDEAPAEERTAKNRLQSLPLVAAPGNGSP